MKIAELATREIAKAQDKRTENRAWVEANMPEVATLFDGLLAAGMNPKLVKLEKFA